MLWIDHKRIDTPQGTVDARDRGLLLGDGLFDTSLVVNGRVPFLSAHLDRFEASCTQLDIPFARPKIGALMREAAQVIGQGSMRLTVTRGPAPRGLAIPDAQHPMVMISGNPGGFVSMFQPLKLMHSPIRRNETSPAARMKTLGYIDAVLALRDVRAAGADEALFLNSAGHIACCGTGNLFVLRDDRLLTPPLSDGVLDGITRQQIIALAPELGLKSVETSLQPGDLLPTDTLFMTNSLRLIAPAVCLDGKALAPCGLEQLSKALIKRITDECGPWDHPPRLPDAGGSGR